MQTHDNPFPLAGDNFRTVAHVQTDLELAVVVLELGFPVLVMVKYIRTVR